MNLKNAIFYSAIVALPLLDGAGSKYVKPLVEKLNPPTHLESTVNGHLNHRGDSFQRNLSKQGFPTRTTLGGGSR